MTLSRLLSSGVAVVTLALIGPGASADDKKGDGKAPAGVWAKKDGQVVVEFADKGVVKLHPHGDKADLVVVCSFTAGKGGVIKVKVTDHEGKDDLKAKLKDRLPVGTEFQFTWAVTGDAATLDEVDGKEVEGLKSQLEGGYEKK
jgi:hypothetical protein